jgi:hypothetical protein
VRRLPDVEIVVEPETLESGASGNITGRVWLRDGRSDVQADFPEVGWSDSAVALLAAWMVELERLARSVPAGEAVARCRFLDGPYSFTVRAEEAGIWRIACMEERSTGSGHPGPEWLTDQASFLASLRRAARGALSACDSRRWWNADTELLRRRLESGSEDTG